MQTREGKRRSPEYQSEEPPKVKFIFYSLTRIGGVRKCASMNGPIVEDKHK